MLVLVPVTVVSGTEVTLPAVELAPAAVELDPAVPEAVPAAEELPVALAPAELAPQPASKKTYSVPQPRPAQAESSAPQGTLAKTVGMGSAQPQDWVRASISRQAGVTQVLQMLLVRVTVGQPVWEEVVVGAVEAAGVTSEKMVLEMVEMGVDVFWAVIVVAALCGEVCGEWVGYQCHGGIMSTYTISIALRARIGPPIVKLC